jgi:adenosylcobinamide kinase/adenosylcobinamide-phosphate guanylyltransferase
MGIVPEHALSRRYRDVAGRLTQRIAAMAEKVVLMVCGQPLTVKSAPRREGSHD